MATLNGDAALTATSTLTDNAFITLFSAASFSATATLASDAQTGPSGVANLTATLTTVSKAFTRYLTPNVVLTGGALVLGDPHLVGAYTNGHDITGQPPSVILRGFSTAVAPPRYVGEGQLWPRDKGTLVQPNGAV